MLDFVNRECGALINSAEDLQAFLERTVVNVLHTDGLPVGAKIEDYVQNVVKHPATYPYFVISHFDDEREVLRLYYVTPSDFNSQPEV